METLTIRLGADTQQVADIQQIKLSADNMAAAALSFAKDGALGYDSSLQTRQDFEDNLNSFIKNYKRCEIVKQ
jgi:hypothetical protein